MRAGKIPIRSKSRRSTLTRCIVAVTVAASSLLAQTGVQRPHLLGIAHTAFRVSDLGKTGAFYEASLGFADPISLAEENGQAAIALVKVNDEQYVELLPGDAQSEGQLDHFALYTDDLAAMREYLLAQRIPLLRDIHPGRVGNPFLTIRDSDGHPLEIVEYSPSSLTGQSKGKFMPADRITNHITHVGIVVRSTGTALKFYRDLLGFREISHSTGEGGQPGLIVLQTPDGNDFIELIPFAAVPSANDMKANNHFCLATSDLQKAAATLQSRLGSSLKPKISVQSGGGLPPRLDVFDPDGARIEIMEAIPAAIPATVAPRS
jgi:catechol 2,3-dioxygenase-like lactoylglutathione lyase family enzyme